MDPFGPKACGLALVMSSLLGLRAIKKKSLTTSGAIAGCCVGFAMVVTGLRGYSLFFFYQLGSWATKYKKALKASKDATCEVSSVRGAGQVLAVSVFAVGLSLWHAMVCGAEKPINFEEYPLASRLTLAVLAHQATALADTLASELGLLATKPPVLIIRPWETVPPGTNGGVTLNGFGWSLIGGILLSLFQLLMDSLSGITPLRHYGLIVYGAACGLLGSIVDSVLGATAQVTYYDPDQKLVYHSDGPLPPSAKLISGMDLLTNEQVNFVSMVLTSLLGGWVLGPLCFS